MTGSLFAFEPAGGVALASEASMDASDRARWQQDAVAKLQRIAGFGENWDSYGGRPISSAVVARMLDVLEVVAYPRVPEPAVVPTAAGGLQLEWHVRGFDLEVEVAPGETALVVSLEDRGEEVEESLLLGSSRFHQVLQKLVSRTTSRER